MGVQPVQNSAIPVWRQRLLLVISPIRGLPEALGFVGFLLQLLSAYLQEVGRSMPPLVSGLLRNWQALSFLNCCYFPHFGLVILSFYVSTLKPLNRFFCLLDLVFLVVPSRLAGLIYLVVHHPNVTFFVKYSNIPRLN